MNFMPSTPFEVPIFNFEIGSSKCYSPQTQASIGPCGVVSAKHAVPRAVPLIICTSNRPRLLGKPEERCEPPIQR